MKKVLRIHGCAKQSLERLAARILKHQGRLPCSARKLQRPNGTCQRKFVPQLIFSL